MTSTAESAAPTAAVAAVPAQPDLAAAPRIDFLLLAFAVGGVALSAPLISAIAAPAVAIAFWRNAIATGVLAPITLLRHRAELRAMTRRTVLLSLSAGAFLALHFAMWLPSLRLTSVATSTALCTATPLWTTLYLRIRGQRPPRVVWLGIGIAFAGVVLLTGFDLALSSRAVLGDLLALGAGMAASGYFLLGSEVRRTVSTTAYTFVCYATTAAILLVACLLAGQSLSGYSATAWWQIALLTASAQFLGHSLSNRVVRTLGPSFVSTAILLETPGAALIAAVWLGQMPPVAVYPAMVMILTGLLLIIRAGRKSSR